MELLTSFLRAPDPQQPALLPADRAADQRLSRPQVRRYRRRASVLARNNVPRGAAVAVDEVPAAVVRSQDRQRRPRGAAAEAEAREAVASGVRDLVVFSFDYCVAVFVAHAGPQSVDRTLAGPWKPDAIRPTVELRS